MKAISDLEAIRDLARSLERLAATQPEFQSVAYFLRTAAMAAEAPPALQAR